MITLNVLLPVHKEQFQNRILLEIVPIDSFATST